MKQKKRGEALEAGTVASYIGVIYEEFQHRIDLVVERLDVLGEKVQELSARLDDLEDLVNRGNVFVRTTLKNIERLLAIYGADIDSLKNKAG